MCTIQYQDTHPISTISFGLVSKYRSELMGFSILIIMLYHCWIFTLGDIGVEYFFLLSGVGMYNSLKRDYHTSILKKKRFLRILPTYLIVDIPFAIKTFNGGAYFCTLLKLILYLAITIIGLFVQLYFFIYWYLYYKN